MQNINRVAANSKQGIQFDRERHGGLFDRGSADAWYRRTPNPHWYPNGTGNGDRIDEENLNEDEIKEYLAGYEHQVESGEFKEYR